MFLLHEGMGIAAIDRDVYRDVWHAGVGTAAGDGLFSYSSLTVLLAKL